MESNYQNSPDKRRDKDTNNPPAQQVQNELIISRQSILKYTNQGELIYSKMIKKYDRQFYTPMFCLPDLIFNVELSNPYNIQKRGLRIYVNNNGIVCHEDLYGIIPNGDAFTFARWFYTRLNEQDFLEALAYDVCPQLIEDILVASRISEL